jgi:hypothetical protein
MIAPGGLANIESAAMCVYNAALDSIEAFATLMVVTCTPWW